MKEKWKANASQLKWYMEQANVFFEDGRTWKAMSYLKRFLKSYDGKIPAYLYMKYEALLNEYKKHHSFNRKIEKMTDEELSARISDAISLNRSCNKHSKEFCSAVKDSMTKYLQDGMKLEALKTRLTNLERKLLSVDNISDDFFDELLIVFRAYFYGRKTISEKVITPYAKYIKLCFECSTYEDEWNKMAEEKINSDKEWPAPILCVTDVDEKGKVWDFFYLDPTIPNHVTANNTRQEVMFSLLIKLMRLQYVGSPYKGYDYYWLATNWEECKDNYYMKKLEKRGEIYHQRRLSHMEHMRNSYAQQLQMISQEEREKIIMIWNHFTMRWIKVVD
ncbi:MAG: hypothetical protein IJ220_01505 [Clostridia bacterium]|nr:hypothetical protein [Clostridia bacterium]